MIGRFWPFWFLTGLLVKFGMAAGPALAGVKVAATIAPVHSLVAMVTQGIEKPALIVRPGASPHSYAMKPSEARALDQAEIIFWIGPQLEPWMQKAINTLAADARVIELGAVEGVLKLDFRQSSVWHGHDDHVHGGERHTGERYDPHLWLDPDNAIIWLGVMAAELAAIDPVNAGGYWSNARLAEARLIKMTGAIQERLSAVHDKPYIVFHDAYQYFERRFGLNAVGTISLGDAVRPGAGSLSDIRRRIEESGAKCAFAEPQFEPRLLGAVIAGQHVTKGELDPVGARLTPGAGLYPALMEGLAASLLACLS